MNGGESPLAHRLLVTSSSTVPASGLALFVGPLPPSDEQHVLRKAWPFPQFPDGRFAAATAAGQAVGQLEDLRRRGAAYLVLPSTATAWLAERPHLSNHLTRLYRVIAQDEACRVFDLRQSSISAFIDSILPSEEPVIAILHPQSGLDLAGRRVHRLDTATPEDIEVVGSQGMRFLVLPDLSPWAPEDTGIVDGLQRRYRTLAVRPGICAVFDITGDPHVRKAGWPRVLARVFRDG